MWPFKKKKRANAITTIRVYKEYWGYNNVGPFTWVFDDSSVGLYKEAFVSGANTVCDVLAHAVGRGDVIIQFSEFPFPDAKFHVDYVSGDVKSGTNYVWKEKNQPLWLCPALGCYFDKSPEKIYINFY